MSTDYFVTEFCPGPDIPKWDNETKIQHLFILAKKDDDTQKYDIGIWVNQGKSMACLSSQRFKNFNIKKLLKKNGVICDKNYEHFDKNGNRKKNIITLKDKGKAIFITLPSNSIDLMNICLNIKKRKRKKKKRKRKKKKKRVYDSEDSDDDDDEIENEEDDINDNLNLPEGLNFALTKVTNPKAGNKRKRQNDKDSSGNLDNDEHMKKRSKETSPTLKIEDIKKRIKEMLPKLKIEDRKEILEDIISMCVVEDKEKTEEILFGDVDIKEYVSEKIKIIEQQ